MTLVKPKYLFFYLTLCFFNISYSQTLRNALRIDGKIKEGKEKLDGVRVALLSEGEEISTEITKGSGRFVLEIPLQQNYFLIFSKRGYRSKYVEVKASNIPEADAAYGFEFGGLDVSLFKDVKGLKADVLDKPVAEIIYDTNLYKFVFNVHYFEEIEEQTDSLEEQLAELSENEDELLALQQEAAVSELEEEKKLERQKKDAIERVSKRGASSTDMVQNNELETSSNTYAQIEQQLKEAEAKRRAEEEQLRREQELLAEAKRKEEERIQKEKEEAQRKEQELLALAAEKKRLEEEIAKKKEAEEKARIAEELEKQRLVEAKLEEERRRAKEEQERLRKEKEEELKKEAEKIKAQQLALAAQKEKEEQQRKLLEAKKKEAKAKPGTTEKLVLADATIKKDQAPKGDGKINAKPETTKNIYRKGNKTITELTVQKDGLTVNYRKVIADWGGKYYFKDDIAITEVDWDLETEAYLKD